MFEMFLITVQYLILTQGHSMWQGCMKEGYGKCKSRPVRNNTQLTVNTYGNCQLHFFFNFRAHMCKWSHT